MDVLKLVKISKSFPGVQALKNVDFSLKKGEVHALVGENGAGKSTLVKIIMGVHKPDSGEIYLDGEKVRIHDPNHARSLGIAAIHQEVAVFPDLTVLENLYIGHPLKKLGFLDWDSMRRSALEKMREVDINLPLDEELGNLSTAQQKLVQIFRALLQNARILIMDEPTAALTTEETEILFSNIERLKQKGVSILYISHRLEEVFRISDKVTVLRDGRKIFTKPTSDITVSELIEGIIGKKLQSFYPEKHIKIGREVLRIDNLSFRNVLKGVNLEVREGEILGIAGLLGSGRSTLAKVLFGILKPDSGKIVIDGKEVVIENPMSALKMGIVYVPEDRHRQGLILPESVRFNVSLPNLSIIPRKFLVDVAKEVSITEEMIKRLDIRTPSSEFPTMNLSGGNQQKVVLAKWIFRNPRIFVMDEPTQGIDVGAKNQIYKLIVSLAESGKSIIFISSEIQELVGICDRIVVMRKGEIVGEFSRREFSKDKIVAMAAGFEERSVGGVQW